MIRGFGHRSASLGRSNRRLEPAWHCWVARIGRLSPLGLAGTLEINSSSRFASLGRYTLTARDRFGFAGALKITAPADVSDFEPARLRWDAQIGRSTQLGFAGTLEVDHSTPARLASLGRSQLAARDRFDFAGALQLDARARFGYAEVL